jgi:hypothetical protein
MIVEKADGKASLEMSSVDVDDSLPLLKPRVMELDDIFLKI